MLDAMATGPLELLTAEDLLARGARHKHDELWDGLVLVRSPSGGSAEVVATQVVYRLLAHLEAVAAGSPLPGWVTGSNQGFLVSRDPDRVLSPDGAYTSRARLPAIPRRGYFPCAPDFAVEVRSPDQSWIATVEKCGIWIAHGVACVWGIDPDARARCLVEFRPAMAPRMLGPGDAADARPVLPEFRVAVADLFRTLGQR